MRYDPPVIISLVQILDMFVVFFFSKQTQVLQFKTRTSPAGLLSDSTPQASQVLCLHISLFLFTDSSVVSFHPSAVPEVSQHAYGG